MTLRHRCPMTDLSIPARVRRSTIACALAATALVLAPPPAAAQGTGVPGQGIFMPFAPNQTWYVCQGYLATTSGTHNNNFALDLTRDPDGLGTSACYGDQDYSEGESVYAPGPGVISHYGATVEDLVCLDLDDGGSLLIGHLDPDSRVEEGRVDSQELLGTLAGPAEGDGGVDNGDYSHIHIQAYGGDDCASGAAEPFAGVYKFFGAPDMPDLRPFSALEDNYVNHYFGTGLSYLMIESTSDDAGTEPGCSEANNYNEIYLGNCSGGSKIHSGLRFENLPVNQGEWISAASLVTQVDGRYNQTISVDVRGERNSAAQTFGPGSMPSDRLDNLTSARLRWSISDPWDLGETRETPNLRAVMQELVDRSTWVRGISDFALVLSGTATGPTTHRRFLATERDPDGDAPDFYPARFFVTQFRTRNPGDPAKGNNRPVADAGPDRFYTRFGQKIGLDGRGSFDPDGDSITYSWTQIAGPTVELFGATTARARFTVFGFGELYSFELKVTDNGTGELLASDTVVVRSGSCAPTIC